MCCALWFSLIDDSFAFGNWKEISPHCECFSRKLHVLHTFLKWFCSVCLLVFSKGKKASSSFGFCCGCAEWIVLEDNKFRARDDHVTNWWEKKHNVKNWKISLFTVKILCLLVHNQWEKNGNEKICLKLRVLRFGELFHFIKGILTVIECDLLLFNELFRVISLKRISFVAENL